jgi:hypothetical protein
MIILNALTASESGEINTQIFKRESLLLRILSWDVITAHLNEGKH